MPAAEKETAYVLPEDAVASSEAQVFPGFNGVFLPGVPVAVSDLGYKASEAAELVKTLELPLKKTTAKPTLAEGETPSSASVPSEPGEPPVELSPMPGLSKDDFEARLKEDPVSPVIAAAAEPPAPGEQPATPQAETDEARG